MQCVPAVSATVNGIAPRGPRPAAVQAGRRAVHARLTAMRKPRRRRLLRGAGLLLVACNASGGTRPTVQQGASPEPEPAGAPEAEPDPDDDDAIAPVRHIGIYVQPYYASGARPEDPPTVHVGDRYDALLSSTRREDVIRARDLIEAEAAHVTPMSMMVLSIRLYDVGLRDEAVMWFYAAKGRTHATWTHSDAPGASGGHRADRCGVPAHVQRARFRRAVECPARERHAAGRQRGHRPVSLG